MVSIDDTINKYNRDTRYCTKINDLPNEILLQIFDLLHLNDKIRLRRTCRRWNILLEYIISSTQALNIGHFVDGSASSKSAVSFDCHDKCHSVYFLNEKHFNFYMQSIKQHSSKTNKHGTTSDIDLNIDDLQNYSWIVRKRRASFLSFQYICLPSLPADEVRKTFSIYRYDILYRIFQTCRNSLLVLSLGHIDISQRLLVSLIENLSTLEHLELISCATEHPTKGVVAASQTLSASSLPSDIQHYLGLSTLDRNNCNLDDNTIRQARLVRWTYVRSSSLVKLSLSGKRWKKLRHLMVKNCDQLSELTLSLLIAITMPTLEELMLDSCQYFTGEFLNCCNPNLHLLTIKNCSSIDSNLVDEYLRLRKVFTDNNLPLNDNIDNIHII